MADIMISTTNLTKKYGGKVVVDNVSLQIERGGIIGLVGQNGAGKTTLIRLLTGLAEPTSGSYKLLPEQERRPTDVAAIVERPSIYSNMSAMDNLIAQSMLLGLKPDKEYLTSTLKLVGLDPTLRRVAKHYSLGMKQRLAIAMTLVGKPQLLILDEPTNGLDPEGIADMRELFVNLNRQMGVTVVISSHILSELSKFATEFYIMDKGRMLKRVTADEIKSISGKRVSITTDNTAQALVLLQQFGEAVLIDYNKIQLTTNEAVTQIMLSLAQAGITVYSFDQADNALEEYYLDIVRKAHQGGAL